jgi:enediyne biosynthesis protein E7
MEMHLVLAMIVRRFTLALMDDAEVEPEALVTLRPKGGLWMTPRPWEPGHG